MLNNRTPWNCGSFGSKTITKDMKFVIKWSVSFRVYIQVRRNLDNFKSNTQKAVTALTWLLTIGSGKLLETFLLPSIVHHRQFVPNELVELHYHFQCSSKEHLLLSEESISVPINFMVLLDANFFFLSSLTYGIMQ